MKCIVSLIICRDYIGVENLLLLDTLQIGVQSWRLRLLETKYGELNIPHSEYTKNIARLTNQIWKLIPMKENQEDWEKQLDTVIIEIVGMNEIFSSQFV